jgi:hypothetical protein
MSPSRFLLISSLVALAGCDDDARTCGPGAAPPGGMHASSADVTLEYEGFSASPNNDCPDHSDPNAPTSLTITAKLAGGMTGFLTVCIPHPEDANQKDRSLGADQSDADFLIVDVVGAANGCTFKLDGSRVPTGTGQTSGLCANGTDPAGFALTLDGAIGLKRTCGATIDTIGVTLAGTVSVGVPE